MTFFSRCEAAPRFEPGLRPPAPRRTRVQGDDDSFLHLFAGFAEDLGILFRYAAGLDYYGRDRLERNR